MVEVVEDGGTVRITTPGYLVLRVMAYVALPFALLLGASIVVLASTGSMPWTVTDTVTASFFAGVVIASAWVRQATVVTLDRGERTVVIRKRYAYRRARDTTIPFGDIHKIELFRDTLRGGPWISMWLHRREALWVRVAGPIRDNLREVAAIERAAELAHQLIGAPITGSAREPRGL